MDWHWVAPAELVLPRKLKPPHFFRDARCHFESLSTYEINVKILKQRN
jgi:hypothetical protein